MPELESEKNIFPSGTETSELGGECEKVGGCGAGGGLAGGVWLTDLLLRYVTKTKY